MAYSKKYSRQELIIRAKPYFEGKNKVKVMFATEDGNFFYEAGEHFADSHSRDNKLKKFRITEADLRPAPKPEVKPAPAAIKIEPEVKPEPVAKPKPEPTKKATGSKTK